MPQRAVHSIHLVLWNGMFDVWSDHIIVLHNIFSAGKNDIQYNFKS